MDCPAPSSDDVSNGTVGDVGCGEVYRVYDDGFTVRRMTPVDALVVISWYSKICATSSDVITSIELYDSADLDPAKRVQAYVGLLDGQVIASTIRTPSADGITYQSLLYVEEKYRGRGYARRMNEASEAHLNGAIICIDAHEELLAVNKRRGYAESFQLVHYTGRATSMSPLVSESIQTTTSSRQTIVFYKEIFDALIDFDNKCFVRPSSRPRRQLLERYTSMPRGQTIVSVIDSGGSKSVVGFACRQPAYEAEGNHIVGPVYAESYEIARDLMKAITENIIGESIWLTICVPNKSAVQLVQELQLTEHIHMIRMHKNGDPRELNDRVFAVTSIDICGF